MRQEVNIKTRSPLTRNIGVPQNIVSKKALSLSFILMHGVTNYDDDKVENVVIKDKGSACHSPKLKYRGVPVFELKTSLFDDQNGNVEQHAIL